MHNIVHDTKQAILDRLTADTFLAQRLGQYRGQASIFGFSPIPESAKLPAVICEAPLSVEPVQSKSPKMTELEWEIRIVGDRNGDPTSIDHPAELLREIFEAPLDIPGHHLVVMTVSGPVGANDRRNDGRVIDVSMTVST